MKSIFGVRRITISGRISPSPIYIFVMPGFDPGITGVSVCARDCRIKLGNDDPKGIVKSESLWVSTDAAR